MDNKKQKNYFVFFTLYEGHEHDALSLFELWLRQFVRMRNFMLKMFILSEFQ